MVTCCVALDDTLQELADEYADSPEDWPYGVDVICDVLIGQAAWLLEEARRDS